MGIKLEIGCGMAPKSGYEHLDIQPFPHVEYVADAMNIPLADGTVSEIFTANMIEHFWWFQIDPLLKEWNGPDSRALSASEKITMFSE